MISHDRIQELRIIADRGNAELGELLDAYEDNAALQAEIADLESERDELQVRIEDLEAAIEDAKQTLEDAC